MEKQETQAAYAVMRAALNERQWRLYLAVEAARRGRGSISALAREAQTTRGTIHKGITELEGGQGYVSGDRIRCPGGGRKSRSSQDPTLVRDLEALLAAKGDPMRLLQSTSKSISHLHTALLAQGHIAVSYTH